MSETLSTTQDSAPFYQNTLEALGVAPVSPEDFDRLLSDHLARYLPYLGGEDRVPLLFGVVKGLLSDLSRKTDDPARQELAKTLRSTPTANFMSRDDWDDPGALAEHQRAVAETLGGPGAMITCDTVDFPKSSHMPPGVARQHAGPRSKMENCQIAVMIGYVSEKGAELLDYELFMPEAWFGEIYENRRQKGEIPKDLVFRTQREIAGDLLERTLRTGLFQGARLGVGLPLGDGFAFSDRLPGDLVKIAEIHGERLAFPDPDISVEALPVKHVVMSDLGAWSEITLDTFGSSPIAAKHKLVKVADAVGHARGGPRWLHARRFGQDEFVFAFSNEPMDAPLDEVRASARGRLAIELCLREARNRLSLGRQDVRTWLGMRRHMLLALIAHSFVGVLRRRDRAGAPAPNPAP